MGQRNLPPQTPSCVCGLLVVSQSLARPHSAVFLIRHNHCFLQCFYSRLTKRIHCPCGRKDSKTHLLHNSDPSQQRGRRGELGRRTGHHTSRAHPSPLGAAFTTFLSLASSLKCKGLLRQREMNQGDTETQICALLEMKMEI